MKNYPKLSNVEVRLIREALETKGWTQEALASEILALHHRKVARETISRYLRLTETDRMAPPPKMREILESVLGFAPYTLVLRHHRNFLGKTPLHDLKNRLNDPSIQRAFLHRDAMPSLVEAVRNTEVFLARSLQEKSREPTHYFQLGAVFKVSWPGQRQDCILTYLREPKEGTLKCRLVTGRAILFGASFHVRESHPRSDMDLWMEAALERPETAAQAFTKHPSLLAKLLNYKLEVLDLQPSFSPWGVVTNDLRKTRSAAYTAFVFSSELRFSNRPRAAELARLSTDGSQLFLEDLVADPETICVDSKGRPLCMDIAVWRALQSNSQQGDYQTAVFTRGFTIA